MAQVDEAKLKNELTEETLQSCCMALKLMMGVMTCKQVV